MRNSSHLYTFFTNFLLAKQNLIAFFVDLTTKNPRNKTSDYPIKKYFFIAFFLGFFIMNIYLSDAGFQGSI